MTDAKAAPPSESPLAIETSGSSYGEGGESEIMVAGILITHLPNVTMLSEHVQSLDRIPVEASHRWKQQIKDAISYLHSLKLAFGADTAPEQTLEDQEGYHLNEHTVLITSGMHPVVGASAYLSVAEGSTLCRDDPERSFERSRAKDFEALRKLFQYIDYDT